MPTNPLLYFVESLEKNATITRLDLSYSGVDYAVCFVLEQVLADHKSLQQINLGGNPLGSSGLECLVRWV